MPEHLGNIRLKGKAADKLLKSVGNPIRATIVGKVESASFEIDYSDDRPVSVGSSGSNKERKKVAQVTIDIEEISGIHNSAHKSLKEIVED